MLYSQSTNGFYTNEINGENVPQDAVSITNEQYRAMLDGQYNGKIISADSQGNPSLMDSPSPTVDQITEAVTSARSAAYRSESDQLFFKVQRGEAKKSEWVDKIKEIKLRFPDGVMPFKK